ncbi:MAG: hypothetical protein V1800_04175 [Candidatus Latescibacterota bacterium]
MKAVAANDGSDPLYLHVNTLASLLNLSDQVLAASVDPAYIEQMDYSERSFSAGEVRAFAPLTLRPEISQVIDRINDKLGRSAYGNGITVRVSWMHGSTDLPSPEEIERAGGHLIVKCYVHPFSFNRARERDMRVGSYVAMRIGQILERMKEMGGQRVWWFIGDEPFSSYHWHGYLKRTGGRGGQEPFSSREEAYSSYRDYVLGNQMDADTRKHFIRSEDYRAETEEAGNLYFYPYAQRKGLDLDAMNISSGSTAPMDAHYQLEWHFSKMFLLERVFLGGIQMGVAFARGAAKQHGRYWGTYQEIWDGKHYGNASYTRFDEDLNRMGGLSADMLLRARLVAFFSGVHVNSIKGAQKTHFALGKEGELLPTQVAADHERLADFCLRKYPLRGETHTPVALLLEHLHGWNPVWAEADRVWGTMPFEEGDYMIGNFFDEAFPRRTTGWQLLPFPPHHPFGRRFQSVSRKHQTEEYRRRLRQGYDHRAYEHRCLTASRWGNGFDVVLENASLEVLQSYPVVMMLGRVKLDGEMATKLKSYVAGGGHLLINVRQLGDDAGALSDFLGVALTGEEGHSIALSGLWRRPRGAVLWLLQGASRIQGGGHGRQRAWRCVGLRASFR